ncbi:alpha/beta hydrolase [Aetokthonos hydrillicola Thurmond2011]|jgi:haloalkane dehalogenase|uniref:Alpha/beta hydrolase n=1 Tax=Aetokthonos hydrillicola Thurmond2011 TaxID=2712845 RepID=A0AAP5MA16_9CYAN|nr:alpha/beta hydrolase [Aetokthonos hydrillicola]MBO3461167.1 alpha/beta hydrolase [Aetokthonos hydrillicola CCALA 1050]MBW4588622.1 alpha/beta hydrolase [Aetokthonos hydrillicola CCALA 1050]MDR9896297.1 alpha/beta hydrolase [Aetokthonos hydrillicola Thurmond2011]
MEAVLRNSRRKLSQGLLFWREVGKGTPVIFLHGAWSDSSQWVSVMEFLSHDIHCFAPDLFGFGESDYPNIHYSIDLQVECLAEFLQALKLEKVYLVGHSLGAWIATSYALKYPEKVYGLVLLAPEGVPIEGQKKRWQTMRLLVNLPTVLFQFLRRLRPLTKVFGCDRQIEQNWQFRQLILQHPTGCQLLFQRQQPEIEAELLDKQLYLIIFPVLIVQGGKDAPEALALSQAYAKKIPTASLKMIPHAGSDLSESCAELVADDIRDFIKVQQTPHLESEYLQP